jgi:outer membrane protein OmpA-like peptidoglycan-associated protein
MSNTQKGGAIGGGAGAAVGGLIGHATGSTARGALIGAVVGGAAGALIGRRMDQQAEQLTKVLPDAQVSRVGEGIAVTFDSGILFPFDSAELQGAGRDNLRRLADSLQENARTEIMLVGHTDSVGQPGYNQELSERRARAAADYLSAQGVSRSRLLTSGKGEAEPIASNDDDAGRRRNRRVEVAIYADKQWREEARREAGSD